VLELAGVPNVIASSTNPTLPFGRDAVDEHFQMIVYCHALKPDLPGDAQIVQARVRAATMAAESVLHDRGVIPITSSDAQGMGRAGETVRRTLQLAAVLKPLDDEAPNDNERVLRYMAKLTINPAIAQGISHEVGSIEVGKLADLVIWKPAFFGVKPSLILKGGMIAAAAMGDPNASIPTPQPVHYRPMFGAFGGALATSVTFVSQAALKNPLVAGLGLKKPLMAVKNCRGIGKKDMVHNSYTPKIEVDPENYLVKADGELLMCEPAKVLPMAQRYFLV
jgi:urease subunit alpha